jgi:hypothetical protein
MRYIRIIGEQLPYDEVVVGHMMIDLVSSVIPQNTPFDELCFLQVQPCFA